MWSSQHYSASYTTHTDLLLSASNIYLQVKVDWNLQQICHLLFIHFILQHTNQLKMQFLCCIH